VQHQSERQLQKEKQLQSERQLQKEKQLQSERPQRRLQLKSDDDRFVNAKKISSITIGVNLLFL
jgi:hypothetical protein